MLKVLEEKNKSLTWDVVMLFVQEYPQAVLEMWVGSGAGQNVGSWSSVWLYLKRRTSTSEKLNASAWMEISGIDFQGTCYFAAILKLDSWNILE